MMLVRGWRTGALMGGAALLTLAMTGVAGEAVARYRERHRTTLVGTLPLLFYQHGRLGHALVRDFDYFGWIHVNHQGFRGPDVAVQKAPSVLRIMAVGSSTTFDPSVSGDTATWPARLRFWLNQLSPGRPVEVINAGVPGYRVIEDLIRLETELYRYQPDIVVLYEGHNDLFGALRGGRERLDPQTPTPGEVPVVTPWGHWLSRHSLLYGKLVARVKALRFSAAGRRALATAQPAGQSDDAVINVGAQQFERDVASFLAVARTLRVRVVIPEMVHASGVGTVSERDSALRNIWSSTVPFARPETVLRGYVRYNAVLEEVAKQFGATWVPTASFGLTGIQWYQAGDPIHFNDRGADRMAHHLAETLVASWMVDSRAPRPRRKPGDVSVGRSMGGPYQ